MGWQKFRWQNSDKFFLLSLLWSATPPWEWAQKQWLGTNHQPRVGQTSYTDLSILWSQKELINMFSLVLYVLLTSCLTNSLNSIHFWWMNEGRTFEPIRNASSIRVKRIIGVICTYPKMRPLQSTNCHWTSLKQWTISGYTFRTRES